MAYKSILTIVTQAEGASRADRRRRRSGPASGCPSRRAVPRRRPQPGRLLLRRCGADGPGFLQDTIDQAREQAKAAERCSATAISRAEDIRWAIDTEWLRWARVGQRVGRLHVSPIWWCCRAPTARRGLSTLTAIIESALFDGRRARLAFPNRQTCDSRQACRHRLEQSTEALRAIRAALPILKAAAAVNVAVIDPPAHGAGTLRPRRNAVADPRTSRRQDRGFRPGPRTLPRVAENLAATSRISAPTWW